MRDAYAPYMRVGFGFVVLFAMSFYAFYPRYFAVVYTSPRLIHVHYVLSMLWMGMLVAQPVLIARRKFEWHRLLGKISYVLVPLLIVSLYAMLRYSYANDVQHMQEEVRSERSTLSPEAIVRAAKSGMGLPVYSLIILITFYPLAVINRKRPLVHAKYMIAAGGCVVGPILDRTIFRVVFDSTGTVPPFFQYYDFVLSDILFIWLLYLDYKHKRSLMPALVCLSVLLCAQGVYTFFTDSEAWQRFMSLLV